MPVTISNPAMDHAQVKDLLKSFLRLTDQIANVGVKANDRIVLEEGSDGKLTAKVCARDAGVWSRSRTGQTEENNNVRTKLLEALTVLGETKNDKVLKALVGSNVFVGKSDMDGANGMVTSGRPLTVRRISRILEKLETDSMLLDAHQGHPVQEERPEEILRNEEKTEDAAYLADDDLLQLEEEPDAESEPGRNGRDVEAGIERQGRNGHGSQAAEGKASESVVLV